MRILVTDAAGLNGAAVVHEFARRGEPNRALVGNRARARELDEGPVAELVEGELLPPVTLGSARWSVPGDLDRRLLVPGGRDGDDRCSNGSHSTSDRNLIQFGSMGRAGWSSSRTAVNGADIACLPSCRELSLDCRRPA